MRASEGEAKTVAGVASETAGVSLGDTFGDQGLVAGGVTGSEGAGVEIDQTAGGVEGRVGDGGEVPEVEEQTKTNQKRKRRKAASRRRESRERTARRAPCR